MLPGTEVRLAYAKWRDRPHWTSATGVHQLGQDRHGSWLGIVEGTRFTRPGASFVTAGLQLVLLPAGDRWFTATFFEQTADYRWRLYVDVCTPPVLDPEADGGPAACSVDLDLDVVQAFDGRVGVEDEDEFAEHQVSLGYPPEVVRAAEQECARLVAELTGGASWAAEETVAGWRLAAARLPMFDR